MSARRKHFEVGQAVEIIRDTEYGRPWEPAVYDSEPKDFPGWHRARVGVERLLVPARRIRVKTP